DAAADEHRESGPDRKCRQAGMPELAEQYLGEHGEPDADGARPDEALEPASDPQSARRDCDERDRTSQPEEALPRHDERGAVGVALDDGAKRSHANRAGAREPERGEQT